jgi:hypothetical protein
VGGYSSGQHYSSRDTTSKAFRLAAVTKPSSLVRVTLGVLQHVVEECQSAATFLHKIQAHGPERASVWMFDFPLRLLFYSV